MESSSTNLRFKIALTSISVLVALYHAYYVEKTVHYAADAMVFLGVIYYLTVAFVRSIHNFKIRIMLLVIILAVLKYYRPAVQWSTMVVLSAVVLF